MLTGPSCNCAARSWHSTAQIKYPIASKLSLSRAHESVGSGPGSVRPAKLATRETADAQGCAGPIEQDDDGDSIGNCMAWHLSGASSARDRPAPSAHGLVIPPLGLRLRGPRASASPRVTNRPLVLRPALALHGVLECDDPILGHQAEGASLPRPRMNHCRGATDVHVIEGALVGDIQPEAYETSHGGRGELEEAGSRLRIKHAPAAGHDGGPLTAEGAPTMHWDRT